MPTIRYREFTAITDTLLHEKIDKWLDEVEKSDQGVQVEIVREHYCSCNFRCSARMGEY